MDNAALGAWEGPRRDARWGCKLRGWVCSSANIGDSGRYGREIEPAHDTSILMVTLIGNVLNSVCAGDLRVCNLLIIRITP